MRTPPLKCRLTGHKYVHQYAYGAESIGHVVVICKRRNCARIARTYTETNPRDYSDGFN